VILSVTAYMSSVGDFVGDCIYAKWMVIMRWIVCVNICIVVESYAHAYMTDGDGFYIQNVRRVWNLTYDVFVASGWRPCWWWYRMHIWIMYRCIIHPCMSLICICVWWMKVIGELHVGDVVKLFVWTYALLLSHMFMHTWLMVTDFISKM
jgi:hypothetical protein